MQESTKLTHGGIRKGAGPKRKFDKLERRTVTLTPEHVALLEKLGDGNLSAGIRKMIEILDYIDHVAPRADSTCDEPGITLSEAARRKLAEK